MSIPCRRLEPGKTLTLCVEGVLGWRGSFEPQNGCQLGPIEGGEFHHELIEMNESVQNSRVLFNKWIKAVYVARRLIFVSLILYRFI